MFFPADQNDYALNLADPDAIIYRDANHELHRLTEKDFESPEEFRRWKTWSDESYHKIFKCDRAFYDHKVSLGKLEFSLSAGIVPHGTLLQDIKTHRLYCKATFQLRRILTKSQYRRYIMLNERKMSQKEIAKAESISQSMVSKSIASAEKRIKEKFVNKL